MLQYSSVQKRLYCKSFSIHVYFLIAATILFSLGQSPLADIHLEKAINSTPAVHINHLAWLVFALGFRGITEPFVSLHKIISVLIGMFPTLFVVIICLAGSLMMVMTIGLSLVTQSFTFSDISDLFKMLPYWFVYYIWACSTWFFIMKYIYRHYAKFERSMNESRFNTTVILLFFLGCFGAHRFYIGRLISGTLYMATFGFLGIGIIVDAILLYQRKLKDCEGLPI